MSSARRTLRTQRSVLTLVGGFFLIATIGVLFASAAGLGFARTEKGLYSIPVYMASAPQPMRTDSLTILDLCGTPLSRSVAHRLLERCQEDTEFDFVTLQFANDPQSETRLGSQLLVLEEVLSEDAGIFLGRSRAIYNVFLGHALEAGWWRSDMSQSIRFRLHPRASVRALGSVTYRREQLAECIVEAIELEELLEQMRASETVASLSSPEEAAPPDLSGARPVLDVLGMGDAPVLRGRRLMRSAEALWRLETDDARERIEQATRLLGDQGWSLGGKIRGKEGHVVRVIARRESRVADFMLEANRPPGASDVLWLHYREEPGHEQLRQALAEASEQGPAAREHFLANLSEYQEKAMGLVRR